jgi:hypothetical protein
MYKYLLVLAAAFTLNAQEGPKGPPPGEGRPPRPKLTEEQKKQRNELIAKYEERNKVSADDRKLMRSFGPPPGGPRGPRGPKHDGPPPTKDGNRPSKPKKD